MRDEISRIIEKSRNTIIEGICLNLVPLTYADLENVVNLRNKNRNKYYLNQTSDLNLDEQVKWYEAYLNRDNDIYWCVYNKEKQFIGAVRVYDIDPVADLCTQGSFIIDEEYAGGAPFAVEAEILSFDFIFDVLKLKGVINEDRHDNKVMNNLSRKMGFKLKKKTIINEVEYNYYILNQEDYLDNREKFIKILNYWSER